MNVTDEYNCRFKEMKKMKKIVIESTITIQDDI